MKNEKIVTVLTTTFGYEMAVIRGRLEAEGITCFVQDELTVQVNPFYSNAIGGVKLQVMERDWEQAMTILKETGYIENKDLQSSNDSYDCSDEQKEAFNGVKTVFCPKCGSEEVVKTKKAGWLFLLTSFLLIPLCYAFTPFFQKKYYCFDCKLEFKKT